MLQLLNFVIFLSTYISVNGVIVDTDNGKVMGRVASVDTGACGLSLEHCGGEKDVYVFQGIPYAATTGGENRFQAPKPRSSWAPSVLNATAFGPGCQQTCHNPDVPKVLSEDCLNLNIYVPRPPPNASSVTDELLAVGVFFHGGAYKEGSNQGPYGLYEGNYMSARGDVIVVTANYRLGALGFMTTTNGMDGNFGLQDQRAALQWVQRNIAAFGGDKTRVTIWGESAGAMSILAHLTSPLSAGLFSGALMESNVAGFLYRDVKQAGTFGDAVARDLKCTSVDKNKELTCLQNAQLPDLFKAANKAVGTLNVVETVLKGGHILDAFLQWTPTRGTPDLPSQPILDIIKGSDVTNKVPVLIGTNTNEGATFIFDGLPALPEFVYRMMLDFLFPNDAEKVYKVYTPKNRSDARDALGEVVTDYWFRCSSQQIARYMNKLNLPTYMYRYNHMWSAGKELWPQFHFPFCVGRVCHMAELPFVFHNTANWSFTADEVVLSDNMVDAWASFFKERSLNKTMFPWWPSFDNTTRLNAVLESPPTTESTLHNQRTPGGLCAFWDEIGYNH
eukprot:m.160523 g.160523  ORF g.160523 m.160523 type:complete len:561 (+) comp15168_c0_seq17:237-1919(+)